MGKCTPVDVQQDWLSEALRDSPVWERTHWAAMWEESRAREQRLCVYANHGNGPAPAPRSTALRGRKGSRETVSERPQCVCRTIKPYSIVCMVRKAFKNRDAMHCPPALLYASSLSCCPAHAVYTVALRPPLRAALGLGLGACSFALLPGRRSAAGERPRSEYSLAIPSSASSVFTKAGEAEGR